jgi:hypothetical protein
LLVLAVKLALVLPELALAVEQLELAEMQVLEQWELLVEVLWELEVVVLVLVLVLELVLVLGQ